MRLYIYFETFFLQGKISTNCGEVTSRGLDDSEKSLATQLHNQLRAKLARGEEIRGHPGPQPSASNMMQMVSVLLSQWAESFDSRDLGYYYSGCTILTNLKHTAHCLLTWPVCCYLRPPDIFNQLDNEIVTKQSDYHY